MSDVTTATCARGCRRKGRHATTCDDQTCEGCQPRPATRGQLCGPCWGRLNGALADAPQLIRWMRQHVELGSVMDDDRVDVSRFAPAPLSTDAVAAADDLHAMAVSWALLVMEEHPANLKGPSWRGSDVRPASTRVWVSGLDDLGYPSRLGYAEVTSARVYEDARIVGLRAADATDPVTTWLRIHLDWISEQEWAGEIVGEIVGAVRTGYARWPTEESSRLLPSPCPACDRLGSLAYYPPAFERGPVVVQCQHPECGEVTPEDRFSTYAARVEQEQREKAKAG